MKGRIDVIDWALGQVKTNLNPAPKGPLVTTAPKAVHGILTCLGRESSANGALNHDSILLAYLSMQGRSLFFMKLFGSLKDGASGHKDW
jgi:hypothetical protein